jgi:hypothetical protein
MGFVCWFDFFLQNMIQTNIPGQNPSKRYTFSWHGRHFVKFATISFAQPLHVLHLAKYKGRYISGLTEGLTCDQRITVWVFVYQMVPFSAFCNIFKFKNQRFWQNERERWDMNVVWFRRLLSILYMGWVCEGLPRT